MLSCLLVRAIQRFLDSVAGAGRFPPYHRRRPDAGYPERYQDRALSLRASDTGPWGEFTFC